MSFGRVPHGAPAFIEGTPLRFLTIGCWCWRLGHTVQCAGDNIGNSNLPQLPPVRGGMSVSELKRGTRACLWIARDKMH